MRTTTSGQTGPITSEGKRRASLNALIHGLTASSPHALEQMESEFGIDYQQIRAQVHGLSLVRCTSRAGSSENGRGRGRVRLRTRKELQGQSGGVGR